MTIDSIFHTEEKEQVPDGARSVKTISSVPPGTIETLDEVQARARVLIDSHPPEENHRSYCDLERAKIVYENYEPSKEDSIFKKVPGKCSYCGAKFERSLSRVEVRELMKMKGSLGYGMKHGFSEL